MKIILIDFETTGLDTVNDRIIEVGAMTVDENFQPSGPQVSMLVWDKNYPPITEKITEVTGITQEELNEKAANPDELWASLEKLFPADFIIAYNRAFDENVYRAEAARIGASLFPGINDSLQTPWICAMNDIETSKNFKSKRLAHVALEYGVPVDPRILHRAINDVELMRQMLVGAKANPIEMHKYQQEPNIVLKAIVKKPWLDEGKSTEEAKKWGYNWQVCRGDTSSRVYEKSWVKIAKERDMEHELTAPFEIRRIQ